MISVVIPSYNRRDCILNLLRDVYAQEGCDFEVIVVDDCSSDDTVEEIRREFPQVVLLVSVNNGGPCVSRNRGIYAAKGRIIVGFDSDVTVPDRKLLFKVNAAFNEAPEVSGYAFRIFTPDGLYDDVPRWWHPVPIRRGRDRCFETDYFSGTAYAFRKETMISAGLYPEILYMHYEEVELALRIIDNGGTIIYRPDFGVVHHANPVSRRGEIKVFFKPRNQILLAIGCLPFWSAVRFLGIRLPYQFLIACMNGHLHRFLAALRSAGSLMPRLLSIRQPIRKETIETIDRLREQTL